MPLTCGKHFRTPLPSSKHQVRQTASVSIPGLAIMGPASWCLPGRWELFSSFWDQEHVFFPERPLSGRTQSLLSSLLQPHPWPWSSGSADDRMKTHELTDAYIRAVGRPSWKTDGSPGLSTLTLAVWFSFLYLLWTERPISPAVQFSFCNKENVAQCSLLESND